ncbi:MAG: hypothetical protein MNPFHGCM_02034 [Gemmatimonadaceae bacterium]|nr:hypothetical protein [Gemmatimonadaceae bacterium]
MKRTSPYRSAARLHILTAVVFIIACNGRAVSPPTRQDVAGPDASLTSREVPFAAAGAPEPGASGIPGSELKSLARQNPDQTRLPEIASTTNMIIRSGSASVLVDSLELAIARVTAMAGRLGGFVANTQIQTGHAQVPSATIELKIPALRYDEAADSLAPLGKVEYVNTTAEDVGEEFVDVTARMANARRLEDRLVLLLAQRTGKLEDVLNVERELARIREEIERYEGRLRFLRARVAMSTLTITVHEKAPIVSSNPDENVLGTAVAQAWRNFVIFVAGMIAAMGWAVPAGGIVVSLVFLGRRLARPRRVDPRRAPALSDAQAR